MKINYIIIQYFIIALRLTYMYIELQLSQSTMMSP